MLARLNGYAGYPELRDPGFVSPPALGDDAGLFGALELAAEASAGARDVEGRDIA
jgi:hypothetical protein